MIYLKHFPDEKLSYNDVMYLELNYYTKFKEQENDALQPSKVVIQPENDVLQSEAVDVPPPSNLLNIFSANLIVSAKPNV